jgi:hypothetical protein
MVLRLNKWNLLTLGGAQIRTPSGEELFQAARHAFQTCPGITFIVDMALRVSTMQSAQSASS